MQYGMPSGMDPKAQKRFDNDRVRAAQNSLSSKTAQLSAPSPVKQVAPSRAVNNMQPPVQGAPPMNQVPANQGMVSGGNSIPTMPVEPQVDPVQTVENNMELERFLSSPEVQQSMARSRLRRYFKRTDPGGVPDVALDALQNLMQNY